MLNVLLVEDNKGDAVLAKTRFNRSGADHHLSVASTGAEAIDLLGKQYFDLAFVDINLPDMDGRDIVNHIESSKDLSHISVILSSGMAKPEDVSKEDFMEKPVSSDYLAGFSKAASSNNEENKVKIAVIEEQIRGIREQHKSQWEETKKDLQAINIKMDSVIAFKNQHKGAVAIIATIMGILGGAIAKVIGVMN